MQEQLQLYSFLFLLLSNREVSADLLQDLKEA